MQVKRLFSFIIVSICLVTIIPTTKLEAKTVETPLVSVAVFPMQNATGDKSLDWLSIAVQRMMEIQLLTAKGIDVQWFEHRLGQLDEKCTELKRECLAYQSEQAWKKVITTNLPDVFITGNYQKKGQKVQLTLNLKNKGKAHSFTVKVNVAKLEKEVTGFTRKIYQSIYPGGKFAALPGLKVRNKHHPDIYKLYSALTLVVYSGGKLDLNKPKVAADWDLNIDEVMETIKIDDAELISNPFVLMEFILTSINETWEKGNKTVVSERRVNDILTSNKYLFEDAMLPWLIRRAAAMKVQNAHLVIKRLASFANKSTADLLDTLAKNDNPAVSMPALAGYLGLLDKSKRNTVLQSALSHKDPEVKRFVLQQMGYDPENIPLLINLSQEKDLKVRRAALITLALTTRSMNYEEVMLWLSGNTVKLKGFFVLKDKYSQESLFNVLMSISNKASVDKASKLVKTGTLELKHYAAGHLDRFAFFVKNFTFLLDEKNPAVSRKAALYFVDSTDAEIMDKAVRILIAQAGNKQQKKNIVKKLAAVNHPEVIKFFIKQSNSKYKADRLGAIDVLINHMERDDISSAYIPLIFDKDNIVSQKASKQLRNAIRGFTDNNAKNVAVMLMDSFDKIRDSKTRVNVIKAVAKTDYKSEDHDKKIFDWLIKILRHDDNDVKIEAISELRWKVRPNNKNAINVLREVAKTKDIRVINEIAWSFPEMLDVKSVRDRIDIINERSASMTKDELKFLKTVRRRIEPEVANAIIQKYIDAPGLISEPVVMSVYALRGIADNEISDKLLAIAMSNPDRKISYKAIEIARKIDAGPVVYNKLLKLYAKVNTEKPDQKREKKEIVSALISLYASEYKTKLHELYVGVNSAGKLGLVSSCASVSCQDTSLSPFIIKGLKTDNREFRKASLEALRRYIPNKKLESVLIAELHRANDADKKVIIGDILDDYTSDKVVTALLRYIDSDNIIIRKEVLDVLYKNKNSKKAIIALRKMLFDSATEIRGEAAEKLGRLGAREALHDVIRSLDKFGTTKRYKDEYEEAMELVSLSDLDKLVSLVRHDNTYVREIVANLLSKHFYKYTEAKELLIMLLDDPAPYIRMTALQGLRKSGTKDIFHIATKMTEDVSPVVQLEALKIMVNIQESRALPVIEKFLVSSSAIMRKQAATLIGQTGNKQALNKLLPLLDDTHWLVRKEAAKVLAKSKDPVVLENIKKLMSDKNEDVRFETTLELAINGNKEAKENIVRLVHDTLAGKPIYTIRFSSEGLATLMIMIGKIPPYEQLNRYHKKQMLAKSVRRRR